MATFKITYASRKTEDVEADDFADEGDWITFRRLRGASGRGVQIEQVLRVRAKTVSRIERIGS